jgi:hypothetical protein
MDPAYIEILESNRSLRAELKTEVDNNIVNEKKIRKYLQELDQCYKTISDQDTIIIARDTEILEMKFQISNLEKRLRIALKDIKKKDAYISHLESEMVNFQDEISQLKSRIHKIYTSNIDMTGRRANHFDNIQALLGDIRVFIQNPRRSPFNQNQILTKLGDVSTESNRLNTIVRNNRRNPQDIRTITQLTNQRDNIQRTLDLTNQAFLNEQQERR